jgi:hypothetical protein
MSERLSIDLADALRAAQSDDGGFGPSSGAAPEPEPTALAALALQDRRSLDWLTAQARADGSFGLSVGPVLNDSATALAALAMPAGPTRDRALTHLETAKAERIDEDPLVEHDGATQGWSWTRGTFGWTEPTARALLALRVLRPGSAAIADGLATLTDRQCSDGGWNYGNTVVLDEELTGYAQTTAAALIALQGIGGPGVRRGLEALRRLWREEHEGALSLAMATAALRLHGDLDAAEAERALGQLAAGAGFLGDTVSLAWAALATGPGLRRLAVAS